MRYLLLCVVLQGCGSDKAANTVTAPADTLPSPSQGPLPETAPESPKTVATDPISTTTVAKTSYTMYIIAANIPACDDKNVDQLIYVKDLKQFQVCDGSAWSQVDLQIPSGKDGSPGTAGKDGAVGPQGAAGAVVTAPTNEWLDPVTNRLWLVGGGSTIGPSCTAPWLVPTAADGTTAIVHGLNSVAITHPSDMWISDQAYTGCPGGVLPLGGGGSTGCLGPHGVYCYK